MFGPLFVIIFHFFILLEIVGGFAAFDRSAVNNHSKKNFCSDFLTPNNEKQKNNEKIGENS